MRKALIITAIVIVSLLALLASVYFLAFRPVTLVSDPAFEQVLRPSDIRQMRLSLVARGIRLRIETLEESSFNDEESFKLAISKVHGRWVILSPLCSAYAAGRNIDVSSLLESSVVAAIYTGESKGLFDCTLVSDEATGWIRAAGDISLEAQKTSQNAALICDSDSLDYKEDIMNCFDSGWLSVFEDDGETRLFATITMTELDRQGIMLVLCPQVQSLPDFFRSESTLSWVVDYRYASAVPEKQLYGVVAPDLVPAMLQVMGSEKKSGDTIRLEYRYEKI